MLENTVEWVGGLCLIALPLLISFCIARSDGCGPASGQSGKR